MRAGVPAGRACCRAWRGWRSRASICETGEAASSPRAQMSPFAGVDCGSGASPACWLAMRLRRAEPFFRRTPAGGGNRSSRPLSRPRPIASLTTRSSRWPARSNALAGFAASSVTSVLGRPLITALIRHATSLPPRGPFTSSNRTVRRSMRGANFPRRKPRRPWMRRRSSGSTARPEVRTASGVLAAQVRPAVRRSARDMFAAKGARLIDRPDAAISTLHFAI